MMTNDERPLRSHRHSARRTLIGSFHTLAAVRPTCLAVFGTLFIAGCGDKSNSGPDSGSADDAATSAQADATSADASMGVDAGDDSAGGGQDSRGGGSDSSGDPPSGSPDTGGDVVNESATGTDSGGSTSGLHVQGNSLVDNGQAVRLLGVNISGTETYCEQGIGIFQAPTVNSILGKRSAALIPIRQ